MQLADRLWFSEAVSTRQFAIGEFTIGRPIGVPVLGLGYPVLDESGNVIRVVAHGMTLRSFKSSVDDLPLPPDAVMTITDHDGVILARVPGGEQWVGKRQTDVNLQELYKRGQGEVEAHGRGRRGPAVCLYANCGAERRPGVVEYRAHTGSDLCRGRAGGYP